MTTPLEMLRLLTRVIHSLLSVAVPAQRPAQNARLEDDADREADSSSANTEAIPQSTPISSLGVKLSIRDTASSSDVI